MRFKDIPGYEQYYQISDTGIIWSKIKNRALNLGPNSEGYITCELWKNKKGKKYRVHRLVLLAFVGDSDLEVNHKNGKKHDNRIENLEYCTRTENQQHAEQLGLVKRNYGHKNGNVKLNKDAVSKIKKLIKEGLSNRNIAKMFGVAHSTISLIRRNKTWK